MAACVAATTACGGSADDGSSSGSGGDTSPIRIALVVPLSGEAAVPRIYVDPAEMAVEDLNDEGGIDGREVILDQIDSGFTPQTAITAVTKAISDGADVIVGLPITSQNVAIRAIVDRAQIPVLQLSVGDEANYLGEGAEGGASRYSFRIGNSNNTQVRASVTFAVEELGADKVGLLADVDSATSVQEAFENAIEDHDAQVGEIRTFAIGAPDLTNEVLAMSGNDAVINRSYPNSMALAVKQMVQNDVLIPTIGSQSAGVVFSSDLLEPDMLQYLYGSATCNPPGDEHAQDWLQDFETRYEWTPDQSSPEVYDAIHIFADVVQKAGDDPDAQLAELESLDYTDGICAQRYKADEQHNTALTAVVIGYADGEPKTEKAYDFSSGE
jgi:branched-chain amino acid transport system substrate-binding protein